MNTLNTKTHKRLCSGLIIMLAWSAAPSVTALNFTEFTGLGHLPHDPFYPDEVGSSSATDVSADGSVIVGENRGFVNNPEGFYYTKSEGMIGLGDFDGKNDTFDAFSYASGISADGRVIVGGSYRDFKPESFRYTKSEGMIGLGVGHDFDIDGNSGANSVSSDGNVIVGYTHTTTDSASSRDAAGFRYTESEGIDWIVDPNSIGERDFVSPTDISADGKVIVGDFSLGSKLVDTTLVEDESKSGAFRYTASEGLVKLENLDFDTAISADGSVIVGNRFVGNSNEAVRYTDSGEIVGLGDLPGGDFESYALDVSGDGSVIVGFSSSAKGSEAFIWDDDSNTMKSFYDALIADGLDLSEWSDLSIGAISDDGSTIVGSGTHNGNFEAFAARMFVVPVPAAVWLMGTALLGLLGFQLKNDS